MKEAVIYARYSSDRQNEMSIEGQIEECHRYAKEQGMVITREYVDRAQSATSDKRPNFLRMIRDSKDRCFEIILVYQLDRFSRNKNDSGYYKKILADNGVKVVSAKEQIASDSSGVITEGLLEVFADYFSKQLAEKVHRGMYQRAEQCKYNGGTMTFGYTTDKDGYYIPDEKLAPIVKEIFERAATEETAKSICDDLNQRGIRTTRGNQFSKNSLQNILRNEKYKGIYIFGDVRIPGGIPRIVSDEVFDEVQQTLKQRSHKHRPAEEDYLLTGKLFCGHCKSPMMGTSGTSSTSKVYRYYICYDEGKSCKKKPVNKERLEQKVLAECRKAISDKSIEDAVQMIKEQNIQDQDSPEIIRLNGEIKSLEDKIARLLNQIEDGLGSARAAKRLAEREEQLEGLYAQLRIEKSKQIKLTPEKARDFLRRLRRGSKDNIEYQKMLVHIFVDRIYLYDNHFTLYLKQYNRRSEPHVQAESMVEKYFDERRSQMQVSGVP